MSGTHTINQTASQLDELLTKSGQVNNVLDASSGEAELTQPMDINWIKSTDLTLTANSGLSVGTDTSVAYLSGNLMALQISLIFASVTTLTNGDLIYGVNGLPTDLEARTYRCVMDGDTTAVRYSFACDLIVSNNSSTGEIRLFWQDGIGTTASVSDVTGLYGGGMFLLRKKA